MVIEQLDELHYCITLEKKSFLVDFCDLKHCIDVSATGATIHKLKNRMFILRSHCDHLLWCEQRLTQVEIEQEINNIEEKLHNLYKLCWFPEEA